MATNSQRMRSTNVPACKLAKDMTVDSIRVPTLELHVTADTTFNSEKVATLEFTADTNVGSMRVPTIELTASNVNSIELAADTNYDALSGSGKSDCLREPTEIESLRCGEINPNWNEKFIPLETEKISQQRVTEVYENCTTVNIMITGLTGSGKSGLTNAFLGKKRGEEGFAEEGSDIRKRCTVRVEGRQACREQPFSLKIWDTPGLKDGTKEQEKYLKEMYVIWKRYSFGDLIIYCIKVDTRFVSGKHNPNLKAMKKLQKKFGNEFWRKTVIVLTFANLIESLNPEWPDNHEEKIMAFQAKIDEFKTQIRINLKDYIGVATEIADNIQVIPAGYSTIPLLFDERRWFSLLWFQCLNTIPIKKQRAFQQVFQDRIVRGREADVRGNERKIVLTDAFVPEKLLELERTYELRGGLIGMLGGPFALLTVPLGVVCGKKHAEAVHKKQLNNTEN